MVFSRAVHILRTFLKEVKTMTYSFLIKLNARLFIKVRLLLFINKPGISSASERQIFFLPFSVIGMG